VSRRATSDLAARVARHFSEPEWFTTFEFPLWGAVDTIDDKERSLDALAVSRISGRGNEVHGIEIKSERSDWLRELATPTKAEAFTRILDRFWLVAGEGVATETEVPPTWGFLVEMGSGLRVVRKAPVLEATRRVRDAGGDPIPREVWVRILRRTLDRSGAVPLIRAAYSRGHTAGVKSVEERLRADTQERDSRYERLVETVKAFRDASGVELMEFRRNREGQEVPWWAHGDWAGKRLGAAVRVVLEHQDFVKSAGHQSRSIQRALDDFLKALREAGVEPKDDDST